MMACVSSFDQFIELQSLSGTADSHGFVDESDSTNWTTYEESYASVISKGGREFWKVEQVGADVSHVWRCPFSDRMAAATPDMRLIHETTTYEVLSVVDVDLAHHTVELQTKRAV